MKDIQNRDDIVLLVDKFYAKVLKDELIGVFFIEIVKLDTKVHIPIMYNFWESTLLGSRNYQGNPMIKHIQLNRMKAIKPEHFERWINLWEETVIENFSGEKASLAIQRAKQIGELMQHKLKERL